MKILYLLIPMATLLSGTFLWLFLRSNARGEFDDLVTPSVRLLDDVTSPEDPKL